MRCPRDGAELSATRYEAHVEIDVCPTCRGSFLDAGKLEAIQEIIERDHSKRDDNPFEAATEAAGAVNQMTADAATCPRCASTMTVRRYGMGSQIVIDECPEGCGVWLDGGELAALEEFYEANQADTRLPLRWRLWAGIVQFVRRT